MPQEVESLAAALDGAEVHRQGPFEWRAGSLDGCPVLLAVCGVGKVNAAALTQALLGAGARRVVFTGVAGAVDPSLDVGDVVIGADAVQHDVDVTPLGYELGEVPGTGREFVADPELVELTAQAAAELEGVRAVVGRVVSSDRFVGDAATTARLRRDFGAACTEMEGAAVAQVCFMWGAPFVIVRSISDRADHGAHVDFREFTALAAVRSERVVRGLLRRLAARVSQGLPPVTAR